MKWLSAVALCLMVTCVSSQAYDDWIKVAESRVGDMVSFNCTEAIGEDAGHPRPDQDGAEPWVNATVLYWLAYLEKVDINGSARGGNIVVSDDGWNLTVKNVTPEYHGVYHCVMQTEEGNTYLVKWGINMRGPYFKDLWAQYENNVIIGFSAMGGFLIMAAIIFGVYHFRWIDPDTSDSISDAKQEPTKLAYINQGYTNGAYSGPQEDFGGYNAYDDVKIEPEDEYQVEMKNDPVVVSVAEVYSDSTSPVYVNSTPSNSVVSPLPEPEEDTQF